MWTADSGRSYRLCLLDTNIISEMMKRPEVEGKSFICRYPPSSYVPCFTIYTTAELYRRMDIFEKFLNFFTVYPCFVLKNMDNLLSDEIQGFPDPSVIVPQLYAALPALISPGKDLRHLLTAVFSSQPVRELMRRWKTEQESVLKDMLSLKMNFKESSDHANADDAKRFVEQAGQQLLEREYSGWMKYQRDKDLEPAIDSFPSLKMSLFTTYYRLYDLNRQPEYQDVVDVQNSSYLPYVDTVVTERFQAEIVRKVSCRETFIEHLEVATLYDLRQPPED